MDNLFVIPFIFPQSNLSQMLVVSRLQELRANLKIKIPNPVQLGLATMAELLLLLVQVFHIST